MDVSDRKFRQRKMIRRRIFTIGGSVILIALLITFVVVINISNGSRLAQQSLSKDSGSNENARLELKHASEISLDENYKRAAGTIYLTFDDGPGPYTAELLDILKAKNVKATFFVTGAGDDELILREYQEGHTVGLHTWSHRYDLIYTSVQAYFDDLSMVHDRVQRITGVDSRIIRFPGGSSNIVSAKYDGGTKIMSQLTDAVVASGYQYFDWNLSSGDAGGTLDSDQVFVNIAAHLKEGDNVVLQHDIKKFSVDAVERVIDYGLENGYTFLPLTMESFAAHHGVNN